MIINLWLNAVKRPLLPDGTTKIAFDLLMNCGQSHTEFPLSKYRVVSYTPLCVFLAKKGDQTHMYCFMSQHEGVISLELFTNVYNPWGTDIPALHTGGPCNEIFISNKNRLIKLIPQLCLHSFYQLWFWFGETVNLSKTTADWFLPGTLLLTWPKCNPCMDK